MLKNTLIIVCSIAFLFAAKLALAQEELIVQPYEIVFNENLQDNYWKLTHIRGNTIALDDEQQEPHIVFHTEDDRVAGFAGCNRFFGSYTVGGDTLTFSPLGSTKMYCAQTMGVEESYFDALGDVQRYDIEAKTLSLFDADDNCVLQFEMVALQ